MNHEKDKSGRGILALCLVLKLFCVLTATGFYQSLDENWAWLDEEVLAFITGLFGICCIGSYLIWRQYRGSELIRDVVGEETKSLQGKVTKAQEESASITQYLDSTCHEIAIPMTNVLGMAELLLETPMNRTQREYAKHIIDSARSVVGTMNDMVDVQRVDLGSLKNHPEPVDVRGLLDEVMELWAPRAQSKGVDLLLDYPHEQMRYFSLDPALFKQIVSHLVGNSVKYTSSGHVLLRVDVQTHSKQGSKLLIRVRDSGLGIGAHHLETLFEKYSSSHRATAPQFGGKGVGLFLCKQMAELMGGTISLVESSASGSEFEVTIPAAIRDSRMIASLETEQLKNKKLLIIDDNLYSRNIVLRLTRAFGMESTAVSSAHEAMRELSLIAPESSDMPHILANFPLPDMELSLFLGNLSSYRKKGLKVAITSASRPDIGLEYLKDKSVAFWLSKPYKDSVLRSNLITMIAASTSTVSTDVVKKMKNMENRSFIDPILVVEDNPVNLQVVKGMLCNLGFEVRTALSGEDAVQQVHGGKFSCIFMDCQMPGMDGFETTQHIREYELSIHRKRTPVIALTGNRKQEHREFCLKVGMDDYLSKPVVTKQLEDVVEKWILLSSGPVEADEAESEQTLEGLIASQQILDKDAFDEIRQLQNLDIGDLSNKLLEITPQMLEQIHIAAKAEDGVRVALEAHSLKSACLQLGAERLGTLANDLEEAGKRGDFQRCLEAHSISMKEFSKLKKQLDTYLN